MSNKPPMVTLQQQMKQRPLGNKQTLFPISLCILQIPLGILLKLVYFGYGFPDERI